MSQPNYKLTYYATRGLAEPIRLIFAHAGVTYEDFRIPVDAKHYPVLPSEVKARLPFGKIPVLEFDGNSISQSTAIARYLAKQYNLTGKDDFEAAKCDEIISAMQDFQQECSILQREKNPERKEVLQKEMLEKTYPSYMSKFENAVTSNGGDYYVGSTLTWVDLYMAYIMELAQEQFPEPLKKFPALIKHSERIRS